MIGSLVAWVLNNYIGEYLEDLNTDQLSVALLSGQVELENVPLKKTALRKLDLPLQVRSGLLGKLVLSVPLTHLRSQPWILNVSDILIIVGPLSQDRRYDIEAIEQVEQKIKEQMLDELENKHKTSLLGMEGIQIPESQDSWWGASFLSAVLNNIQVNLHNVHIRYEDEKTIPGQVFNCGVRIQKMTMQTTNSQWKPGFVESKNGENIFKTLELVGFGIYWNSKATLSGEINTAKDLRDVLSRDTSSNAYVIQPCSAEVRMEKNSSKFPLKHKIPRFKLLMRPESISCELTRPQMTELRALNREWGRFVRAKQHRKWRPLCSVGENAKQWWQFAYNRVCDENKKSSATRSWDFAFQRARHMNAYCTAYRRRLKALIEQPQVASESKANANGQMSKNEAEVLPEDRAIMKQIENDSQYTFHELNLFREIVFRRLVREKEKELGIAPVDEGFETIEPMMMPENPAPEIPEVAPAGGGLYNWVTGFFAETNENDTKEENHFDFGNVDVGELKEINMKETKDEILDVLHESWDDSTVFRRDNLLALIALRLEHLTLRFVDHCTINGMEQQRVLAMELSGVSSSIEMSPKKHSHSIDLTVQDMSVQRLRSGCPRTQSLNDSLLYSTMESTKMLLTIGRDCDDATMTNIPMFSMHYSRKSPRLVTRHVINCRLRPVNVVYEEGALDGLSTLFTDDKSVFMEIQKSVRSDDEKMVEMRVADQLSIVESHVLANFQLPTVRMEVRSRGWTRRDLRSSTFWEPGESLACFVGEQIQLNVVSRERFLTKLQLGIGHIEVKDMLENTEKPLISTSSEDHISGMQRNLSNSCPDFTKMFQMAVPTSPSKSSNVVSTSVPSACAEVHRVTAKEAGGAMSPKPTSSSKSECVIKMTFVDRMHEQFESKYKKKNCFVEMDMDDIEMQMNRRTWAALMEMAGLLGNDEDDDESAENGKGNDTDLKTEEISEIYVAPPAFRIGCLVRTKHCRTTMAFPRSRERLGALIFTNAELDFTVCTNDASDMMEVVFSLDAIRIDDHTPLYSELYPEKFILHNENAADGLIAGNSRHRPRMEDGKRTRINMIKYFGDTSDRSCEVELKINVPSTMKMFYIHTHRFFCAFFDFWMQLSELMNLVTTSKKRHEEEPGLRRSRIALNVNLDCQTNIMMPLNSTSPQLIVWQADGLKMTNCFKSMSQLETEVFEEYCIENDYGFEDIDCLIDDAEVVLLNVRAHEACRVEHLKSVKAKNVIGERSFATASYVLMSENVFSRRFDLNNRMLKNLDAALSHNAPDLSIITRISGLKWKMTTQFYILMRGVLEKNIGEMLIPVAETIPIEILHAPAVDADVKIANKYATLSFRMMFEDVDVNLEVPLKNVGGQRQRNDGWMPFANVKMRTARIAFDSFVDGQSELDFISERVDLIDTRPKTATGGHVNLFPVILQNRFEGDKKGLMFEMHLMMKKEEAPVVTIVLCHAKLIMAIDWLDDLKNFLMLYSDFVPKYSDEVDKFKSIAIIERSRLVPATPSRHTFSVKITLRESELYLIENCFMSGSFALVASTTAVLQVNDQNGHLGANLEVQSITVGWCSMQHEKATKNLCSNEFSLTIGLNVKHEEGGAKAGMALTPPVKHVLEVDVSRMICRISYKDARALKSIVNGYEKYLKEMNNTSVVPKMNEAGIEKKPMEIATIIGRTEHADFWLLDDLQSNSIPLFRMSLSNVVLEKSGMRVKASLGFNVDYFNQRIFGWEPLIEEWRILRFLSNIKETSHVIELISETKSVLNINLTEQFIQQAIQLNAKVPAIMASFERDDFRNQYTRSSSDHLPYVMRNETGCDIAFTTAVDDVMSARMEQRKPAIRWLTVARGQEKNFEFPAKLLLYSHCEAPRQLIVRVSGWDEISPVNVDACGTYFRIAKALKPELKNARILICVTMVKDGKKMVTIRSSIEVTNHLPHPIAVQTQGARGELLNVEPTGSVSVPLEFAHSTLTAFPTGGVQVNEHAELNWKSVKVAGEVCNQTQMLKTCGNQEFGKYYWVCTTIRREYYPEHEFESLPGHSIHLVAPMSVQNLLPIDIEMTVQENVLAIAPGKSLLVTSVDITKELSVTIATDRLQSQAPFVISKVAIGEGLLVSTKMVDQKGRFLDVYCHVRLGLAHSIVLSFWVPYWIVNKSGLPLIIQQDAVREHAAGQMEEHEKAKDRHPLMFSFADENCPKACRIRVGNQFVREEGYRATLSDKFTLTPGVQALKLKIEHRSLPTRYYNVGVEVRAGTGKYKDTQIVLLTSRFLLQNRSSVALAVCHYDLIDTPKEHVNLAAQSSMTWNENYAARRMVCVKRGDVKHWSCPFLIDRIGSFHVTMRDSDETPRFIRVEIILTSAVFQVTFTNADVYPPPMRIENCTDVPVLYQQESETPARRHLRTICKSNSTVDYAWDDLYGPKKMVLQVFENRSKSYVVGMHGAAEDLVYENNSFIQLTRSFEIGRDLKKYRGRTDEQELVLETMQKGKVMLNKQNRTDGNMGNQFWRLCADGCIENVGMNMRNRPDSRFVLDVLEKTGARLMMMERDRVRDRYQKWTIMPDGRLCLQNAPHLMLTAQMTEVVLAENDTSATERVDDVAVTQRWRIQKQRPGSGKLGVEFLHSGPTVVVKITDRADEAKNKRTVSAPMIGKKNVPVVLDVNITMKGGLGVSIVNAQDEELIYANFAGIFLSARKINETYQMTASVNTIQIDNQLLTSDRWQVLYCQSESIANLDENLEELTGVAAIIRPVLKLEMNCTPMKHYDSFDCFRLKLCDMSVQLDELLLWKFVQMFQACELASSGSQQRRAVPNIELEHHDPLRTRRWYFGTLDLEMGHVSLSVVTVPKSGLPKDLRELKQQFNVKLVSFENAVVSLPAFRQYHYFETSSFLLESLQKFYMAELQKQTLNIIVTLDAFGNPLGLVTDLKDSFQGLVIEGDVQRFVAGLGYGLSNSVSKMASSAASGVGALTFDQEHELKRRHNMIRSHSASSTPLTHLYSGVKGLGVGVFGGVSAIFTNSVSESKRNGLVKGVIRGMATGVVDTFTKPVQGVFDFVEGTASAMKEFSMPSTSSRRSFATSRVRVPRLCRNIYHLLPAYNANLANAQMELLRINGYSTRERLLDVETCFEHFDGSDGERLVRQYVLITTKQCYVCKQTNGENLVVIQRIAYKYLKNVTPKPPLENTFASIEVRLDMEDLRLRQLHVWCSRMEVANRLADKMMRAKQLYDHNKRTLNEAPMGPGEQLTECESL